MSVAWPASDAALLAWSHLLLSWVVAMYYVGRTASVWGRSQYVPATHWLNAAWPKAVVLAVVAVMVVGHRPVAAAVLGVMGVGCCLFLTWARERGRAGWHKRGAELELGTTGAYVALSALIVGDVAADGLTGGQRPEQLGQLRWYDSARQHHRPAGQQQVHGAEALRGIPRHHRAGADL